MNKQEFPTIIGIYRSIDLGILAASFLLFSGSSVLCINKKYPKRGLMKLIYSQPRSQKDVRRQ